LTADKEEIMFQIEILYDFADDAKDLDRFVAEKISANFRISIDDAKRYVEEYKATSKVI
jgi:hypothetical protein